MNEEESYDERLLLVIFVSSLMVLSFFVLTPALRPYYAVLMPAALAASAGVTWWLLRASRSP